MQVSVTWCTVVNSTGALLCDIMCEAYVLSLVDKQCDGMVIFNQQELISASIVLWHSDDGSWALGAALVKVMAITQANIVGMLLKPISANKTSARKSDCCNVWLIKVRTSLSCWVLDKPAMYSCLMLATLNFVCIDRLCHWLNSESCLTG